MTTSFKKEFSLDQRISESNRILAKYPDRVPVIIECNDKELSSLIKKKKFLVPRDISVSYLLGIIRGRVSIPSNKALFIFHDSRMLSSLSIIGEIYEQDREYKFNSPEQYDKFLYINIAYESTFGF